LESFSKYLISDVPRSIEVKEAHLKKELQFGLEESGSLESAEWTVPSSDGEH